MKNIIEDDYVKPSSNEISIRNTVSSLSQNSESSETYHHTMMEFFELCAGLIGSLAR
jgi:hypothetical protein